MARAADEPPADDSSPPASSVEADRRSAEAKQRYENGMGHFNLEEWDPAIDEWKAGYRAKPVPQFLYNIAQAYRASKRYSEALSYYQRYLRNSPKASNRSEVERHISSLTSLIDQENRTHEQPPMSPLPVKTPPPSSHEPVTAPPSPAPVVVPVVVPPPVQVAPPVLVQVAEPTPVSKRKWFWPVVGTAIGVVAVVVVVGVVVGVSGGGDNTRTLPLAQF